jgi:hypothetical protein
MSVAAAIASITLSNISIKGLARLYGRHILKQKISLLAHMTFAIYLSN